MRRLISLISASVALVALALVLFNATTVDRKPPTIKSITLSAPGADAHQAQTVTAIDIEFSEPVLTATVESRFHIEPAVDGAFTWDGSTAIFTPSQKLSPDSDFTISIDSGYEDLAGNADEIGLDGWAFQTIGAPVVVRVTPPDATDGMPLDGHIELVFDRLMDTASVEAALSVEPAAPVAATWSGPVVTLTFGSGLEFGTAYALTIGTAAADTGGSHLAVPFVTHFTTVAAGLGITSLIPGSGVAGIGIETPIAIQFDAPIAADTARSALHIVPSVDGEVRVVPRGGDLGAAGGPAPTGPAAADTLLFVPSAPLAAHTTYTVTLDPTVARLDDPTVVAAGRTWSFTTGAPTVSGQNQIAFLSARSGVRNVWVMNPDGTNQRQLTVELAPVSSFDASRDGTELAYAAGGVVTVMHIDGSNVNRLTKDDGRFEYAPVFAPDGQHVVLARRDASGNDLGYWLVPTPGTTGNERQLVDHGAPPLGSGDLVGDGIGTADAPSLWTSRIAFNADGSQALLVTASVEMYLVDARDPGSQTLVEPIEVALKAAASPAWVAGRDAFLVAGTADGDERSGLYEVSPSGTTSRIPNTDGATGRVTLGPTGRLAYLVRDTNGLAALHLLATDGSDQRLPGVPGLADAWPAFSPDGARLVVVRTRDPLPGNSGGIWVLDLDTDGAEELARDGAFATWIP